MEVFRLIFVYLLLTARWFAIVATTQGLQPTRHHFNIKKDDPLKKVTAPVKPVNKVSQMPAIKSSANYKKPMETAASSTVGVGKSSKKPMETAASSTVGVGKSNKAKVDCSKMKKTPKAGKMTAVTDDCNDEALLASAAYNCDTTDGRYLNIVNAVSWISKFVTPGLPQAKALSWLLNVDTNTNACDGFHNIYQRYSLAVFYFSTIGSDWADNTFWLGQQDECSWYGVTCTNGLVTSLFMDMNNLQGTLPTEIAVLRSLSELHVYYNSIGGTLPTELGSLTSLSLLDLEVNHFEGTLFFEQLLNTKHTLRTLCGSNNQFVGSIPSWIGELTGLQEFWAADNSLTGGIPTELTRLTDLSSWFIYDNKLNGTIPSGIGSLTNLQDMDLSSSELHGSIPNSIGNLRQLRRLVLTQNHITGSIPASLGRVATLVDVYLNKNYLTGSVPAGFGSLVNLQYLLLNGNYLTGSLTEYFSPVLTYIDMSNNAFDGEIPSSFFDLPLLSYLYLSNNTFTGTIPSAFGDSKTLEAVWLDGNKLSGTIPGVLTSVGRPKIKELTNNTLSATTPLSTGDTVIVKAINGDDISGTVVPPDGLPRIKELLLNHNLLTGNMPSSICTLRLLRPSEFRALHADCSPPTGVFGQAQINCENGCCTSCYVGKLIQKPESLIVL